MLSCAQLALSLDTPTPVSDPPGEGVITFGFVLPLSKPSWKPGHGSRRQSPQGLAASEAAIRVIRNARDIFSGKGPKIGR